MPLFIFGYIMAAELSFTPIKRIITDFPHASKINSILYELIKENVKTAVIGGGKRTDWQFANDKTGSKELKILSDWIYEILPQIVFLVAQGHSDSDYNPKLLGFNPTEFVISESWGVHYDKGEGVLFHNHFPYNLSYVYYVRTPEGSSNLILDNEEMFLKEGQIIFFLAHEFHCVEPCDVGGRCCIAGNILYSPKGSNHLDIKS